MVTVVQGKVCAKNHRDRLSRLATIHQRYRRTDFLWHRPRPNGRPKMKNKNLHFPYTCLILDLMKPLVNCWSSLTHASHCMQACSSETGESEHAQPCNPRYFYTGWPSSHNPPYLWLGTSSEYGLHTRRLAYPDTITTNRFNEHFPGLSRLAGGPAKDSRKL